MPVCGGGGVKKSCANCYWESRPDGRCQVCDVGYPFWHKKARSKADILRDGINRAIEYAENGGNKKTMVAMLNQAIREVE